MTGTELVELVGCSWHAEPGDRVRVTAFFLVALDVHVHTYDDAVTAAMRRHTPWGDWDLHTEYGGERPDLEAAWTGPEELDLWAPVHRTRLRRVDQWDGLFTLAVPLPRLLDPARGA